MFEKLIVKSIDLILPRLKAETVSIENFKGKQLTIVTVKIKKSRLILFFTSKRKYIFENIEKDQFEVNTGSIDEAIALISQVPAYQDGFICKKNKKITGAFNHEYMEDSFVFTPKIDLENSYHGSYLTCRTKQGLQDSLSFVVSPVFFDDKSN